MARTLRPLAGAGQPGQIVAAAAGGAEGDHGKAREIVRFHVGAQYARFLAPPDGTADADGGITGQVNTLAANFGAGIGMILLSGGPGAAVAVVQILFGIGHGGHNLIEIRAGHVRQLLSNALRGAVQEKQTTSVSLWDAASTKAAKPKVRQSAMITATTLFTGLSSNSD